MSTEQAATRKEEMRRRRALTVTVRTVRTKQRKFKALRKKCLEELRSVLKSCQTFQEKSEQRLQALAADLSKLSDLHPGEIFSSVFSTIDGSEIDLSSAIETLESVIEEVKGSKL